MIPLLDLNLFSALPVTYPVALFSLAILQSTFSSRVSVMNIPIVLRSYIFMRFFIFLDVIYVACPVLTVLTTSIYTDASRWGWW